MLVKLQLTLCERLRPLYHTPMGGDISPSLSFFLFILLRVSLTRAIPLTMALLCPLLFRISFVLKRRPLRNGGPLSLRALPPPGAWTDYDYDYEPSTAQSSKATAPKEEPDTQPVGEPRKATPVKLEPNPQRPKRSRCGLSPDEKAAYRTEFPDDGSSSDASMQSDHDWVTLDAYKHRVFASRERKNAEKMHLNLSLGNPPRPKVVLQRPPPQRLLIVNSVC